MHGWRECYNGLTAIWSTHTPGQGDSDYVHRLFHICYCLGAALTVVEDKRLLRTTRASLRGQLQFSMWLCPLDPLCDDEVDEEELVGDGGANT
jgi:hypothetical protein